MKMKKKWIVVLATSIAIFLVIGSLVTALALSSAKATGTKGNVARLPERHPQKPVRRKENGEKKYKQRNFPG